MTSLHGNNSECGAKEVNIKVSTDFNIRIRSIFIPFALEASTFVVVAAFVENVGCNRKTFLVDGI